MMDMVGGWRAVIFDWDVATFRQVHLGWHGPAADQIFSVLSWIGLGHIQAIACFAFMLSRRNRSLAWPLVITIVVSGLAVAQLTKELLTRERPSLLNFAVPQEGWRFDSFPSGHTSTSFGVAILLWLLTADQPGKRWWGPGATVLALAVGISRVYRGVHWPTDVVGGIFAGAFSATLVYLIYQRWKENPLADDLPGKINESSGESTGNYV